MGRSALEIKLRETAIAGAYGSSDSVATMTASTPTERMSRPIGVAPAAEHKQAERGMVVARSTLIGLCLTAFACGIVTTVALDRHHLRALEGELHAQAEAIAAAQQAAPPAAPAVVEAAPKPVAAPPAAEPVVVQLPPEVGTAIPTPAAAAVPAPARAAAARAPRPAAARVTVRRRPAPAASPAAAEPADNGPAPAWVDPFAE